MPSCEDSSLIMGEWIGPAVNLKGVMELQVGEKAQQQRFLHVYFMLLWYHRYGSRPPILEHRPSSDQQVVKGFSFLKPQNKQCGVSILFRSVDDVRIEISVDCFLRLIGSPGSPLGLTSTKPKSVAQQICKALLIFNRTLQSVIAILQLLTFLLSS